MGLTELSYWSEIHCPYEPNFLTPYLVLPHNTDILVTIVLYAIGLIHRELHIFLLGLGVSANGLLNALLAWFFMHPVPFGPCGIDRRYCIDADAPWVLPVNGTDLEPPNTCGMPPWPPYDATSPSNCGAFPLQPCSPCVSCGMPAYEAQYTAFLAISIYLYVFTWRHSANTFVNSGLVVVWLLIASWSHSFFGFNSPAQIVVGVTVGAVFAMIWHAFEYIWLYPYFRIALNWKLVRWLGYQDNYCEPNPVMPGDV